MLNPRTNKVSVLLTLCVGVCVSEHSGQTDGSFINMSFSMSPICAGAMPIIPGYEVA